MTGHSRFFSGFVFVLLFSVFAGGDELPLFLRKDLPHFHTVVKGRIFRGGQPSAEGLKILAANHVRTIIDLRKEDPNTRLDEEKRAAALGIRFISVPMSAVARRL